ncbi:hypothetical protein SP108700_0391 [Streptococcus pneumoniae CDC1087-00]|nr:hypothetical protein SP108700_0391 [Streptococcus pneumoniae CDC1087-00]
MKSSKLFALAGVTLLAATTLAACSGSGSSLKVRRHSHTFMKQTLITSTI